MSPFRNPIALLVLFIILAATSAACAIIPNVAEIVEDAVQVVGSNPLGDAVDGNGNVISETREVSGFDRITLAGIGDADIRLGESDSLVIEAEENLLPYLISEVNGSELVLRTKVNVNLRPTEDIHYTITVTSLEKVTISGLGSATLHDIEAESLDLNISGAGSIYARNLHTSRLNGSVSGTGAIVVDGETTSMTMNMSGAGSIQAFDLMAQEAEITSSGVGSADVRCSDDLIVNISGMGDVRYYGNPQVSEHISGLGNLVHMGE